MLEPFIEMLQPLPGPTEVLGKICDQFLNQNIASVVYITNSEKYGRSVSQSIQGILGLIFSYI